MKSATRFGRYLFALSAYGLLIGPAVQGATPDLVHRQAVVRDVALAADGSLQGQVIRPQGAAGSHVQVVFGRLDGTPMATMTQADGRFQVNGLRPGIYQFQTATQSDVYRVWAPQTAPPAAQAGIVIVEQETIVRGQNNSAWTYLANPWVMGLIAAAAIAIPLALDNGS